MKKIFNIQEENKNSERLVEAIKHEIRKYLKRERTKKLPVGSPFWLFACRVGKNEENTKEVLVQELTAAIDTAYAEKWSECFVEIVARPAKNLKTPEEK